MNRKCREPRSRDAANINLAYLFVTKKSKEILMKSSADVVSLIFEREKLAPKENDC